MTLSSYYCRQVHKVEMDQSLANAEVPPKDVRLGNIYSDYSAKLWRRLRLALATFCACRSRQPEVSVLIISYQVATNLQVGLQLTCGTL